MYGLDQYKNKSTSSTAEARRDAYKPVKQFITSSINVDAEISR